MSSGDVKRVKCSDTSRKKAPVPIDDHRVRLTVDADFRVVPKKFLMVNLFDSISQRLNFRFQGRIIVSGIADRLGANQ